MQILQKSSTASCLCGNREDSVSPREIPAKYYLQRRLRNQRKCSFDFTKSILKKRCLPRLGFIKAQKFNFGEKQLESTLFHTSHWHHAHLQSCLWQTPKSRVWVRSVAWFWVPVSLWGCWHHWITVTHVQASGKAEAVGEGIKGSTQ